MARRNLQSETQTAKGTLDTILNNLVESYGQEKARLDAVKKECDELNTELKKVMLENNITEFSTGTFKVKYTVSEKETMNEPKLLEILTTTHKELTETFELVKMRPYVDFDAIEREVYNGNISQDVLSDIGKCKEVKEVVSLRLSKEKK